jgi:riboflavin kinase/FMN adenylyltransferase
MEVLHQPGDCRPPEGGCVVTIGAYDGVHLGHRQVIRRVRAAADELGCLSAVVTFDHHPATVVRPDSAPKLLTGLDLKLELLAGTGIDRTVVVAFDEEASEEPAEHFVRRILVDCLGTRAVVVGHDFHFGYRRSGDVPLLQRMGGVYNFDVTGVRLYPGGRDGAPVSSTRIRRLLAGGQVEEAAVLLERPHQVRGIVGKGDQRGRELGFPTANVSVPADVQLPADGVYAGWYLRPDGSRHPSAVSLGRRPTFYSQAEESLLEAYLLDFDGDLYGEAARVEFVSRLRDQERYDSIEALLAQMNRDVAAARRVLVS